MVTERFEAQLRAIIRDEVQQAVDTFNKDERARCALCNSCCRSCSHNTL